MIDSAVKCDTSAMASYLNAGLNYYTPRQGKMMYWWSFCEYCQGNMMYWWSFCEYCDVNHSRSVGGCRAPYERGSADRSAGFCSGEEAGRSVFHHWKHHVFYHRSQGMAIQGMGMRPWYFRRDASARFVRFCGQDSKFLSQKKAKWLLTFDINPHL